MRNRLFMLGVVLALAPFALSAPTEAPVLGKLSLDDTKTLGLSIQADEQVKTEGNASLRIVTKWPTTICLGEVEDLDIEEAQLVYSAKVRSELEGVAYLELWAHLDGGQYFSRGMNSVISAKTDWKTIETPFFFLKGQKPDKVTLNVVINGTGTLWVDDVVLSKKPLETK